jgi:hypothetical protein
MSSVSEPTAFHAFPHAAIQGILGESPANVYSAIEAFVVESIQANFCAALLPPPMRPLARHRDVLPICLLNSGASPT